MKLQVFGKAELIDKTVKIERGWIKGNIFPVGGVNIFVENLDKYSHFRFLLEYEENDFPGSISLSYLENEFSQPQIVFFFPLADDFGRMIISGPLQPPNKKIDLKKVKIIQLIYQPSLLIFGLSPLIFIKDFQILK